MRVRDTLLVATLIPVGAASLACIGWTMAPILLLLLILFASYWQTIRAYPSNGGAYIVARENLGVNASLLAAAALMIDYVLNVAVGISAGIAALVSAVPSLHPYMLSLALATLAFVTVMNLRGTLDAGRVFAIPTYTFVVSFSALLLLGIFRAATSGGQPQPVVPPPHLPAAAEAVTLWLLLRSFASGCTAMTGVEAVSNGVGAFREPTVRHAHRTLTGIVMILGGLLAGIAYLTHAYGIGAMDQTQPTYRSVLSQLASAVVGDGLWYYIAIGSLLCVLVFSANTSFVDFPRLCRKVAEDGFLPRPFAIAGHRLVFSIGILYLAVMAGALLVVFGGITDLLIPLFAIGAFLTFTLSQTGMVLHWLRELRRGPTGRERRSVRAHLLINATGALTTGSALAIIVTAKFAEGAWITVLVIPAVIVLLHYIRRYYDRLGSRVRDSSPLQIRTTDPPLVLVTIDEWNQLADKSVTLALSLSTDVIGVHLTQLEGPHGEEEQRKLQERWSEHAELSLSNDTLQLRYLGREGQVGNGGQVMGTFFLSEERDIVLSGAVLFPAQLPANLDVGRRLTVSFGPQVYAALLEEENNDVLAISAGAQARFVINRRMGLAVSGQAFYAPDILTFGSADSLTDLSARAELQLGPQLQVFGGMRWFEFDLTEGAGERTLQEELFFGVGYRF